MTPSHLNTCSWLALRRSQHAVLHHNLANSTSVGGRNPFLVSFGQIWVLFECILYLKQKKKRVGETIVADTESAVSRYLKAFCSERHKMQIS